MHFSMKIYCHKSLTITIRQLSTFCSSLCILQIHRTTGSSSTQTLNPNDTLTTLQTQPTQKQMSTCATGIRERRRKSAALPNHRFKCNVEGKKTPKIKNSTCCNRLWTLLTAIPNHTTYLTVLGWRPDIQTAPTLVCCVGRSPGAGLFESQISKSSKKPKPSSSRALPEPHTQSEGLTTTPRNLQLEGLTGTPHQVTLHTQIQSNS